jgi:hypothetical protein
MAELIIKNGKFYRNGIEERPECGNIEQINCLKETNKRNDEAEQGLKVGTDYETHTIASACFICVCGKKLFYEIEFEGSSCDDDDCFAGKRKYCCDCGRTYIFEVDENYNLIAKMQSCAE